MKSSNASGLDSVGNETLKLSISALLPCLHKLILYWFYPESWATEYISPIFKTGDCRQGENYSEITINSNIGKFFNMILNA